MFLTSTQLQCNNVSESFNDLSRQKHETSVSQTSMNDIPQAFLSGIADNGQIFQENIENHTLVKLINVQSIYYSPKDIIIQTKPIL